MPYQCEHQNPESLELEILSVIEPPNRIRECPEFELHDLIEKNPGMFETVVGKQTRRLEAEIAELKSEAGRLGKEVEGQTGQAAPGGD